MDSQNQTSQKIPAIRTYAKDLEKTRGVQDTLPSDSPTSAPTPKPPAPTPKKPLPKIEHFVVPTNTPAEIPKAPRMATAVPEVIPAKEDLGTIKEDIPAVKPLPPLSSLGRQKKPPLLDYSKASADNTTFIMDNEDAASATIITDTKRDRFKLIPSIISSLKKWFSIKKTSYKAKKVPKYTVPETTRRKGVIQKATSNTGKLATSDFSSIQERIKQRQEEEEKKDPVIAEIPKTEPSDFLPEKDKKTPAVSNVQVVSRKSFRTVKPPEETPKPLPTPSLPVAKLPEAITLTPPTPVIQNERPVKPMFAAALQAEELPKAEPAPRPVPTQPSPKAPVMDREEKMTATQFKLALLNTNTLALIISGIVITIVVASVYAYVIFLKPEPTTSTPVATSVSLLQGVPVTLISGSTNTKEDMLESLQNTLNKNNTLTQIALVYADSLARVVPPSILLEVLDIDLEQNFVQSVSDIRFGYSTEKKPFILMKATNEEAVLGGMLAWENQIYKDVMTILGMPEEAAASNLKFLDASLSGKDVRVLKSDTGEDLLLYGLSNRTVIITSDRVTYAQLLNLIE